MNTEEISMKMSDNYLLECMQKSIDLKISINDLV